MAERMSTAVETQPTEVTEKRPRSIICVEDLQRSPDGLLRNRLVVCELSKEEVAELFKKTKDDFVAVPVLWNGMASPKVETAYLERKHVMWIKDYSEYV